MKLTSLLLVAACSASVAFAGENLPKTLMTERGKLLVSEDFSKPVETAAAPVAAAKGAAKGAAKKTDKAAPKAVAKTAPAPWTSGWRLRPGKWEFVDGAMKGTELKEDKHGAVARFPLAYQDVVIQYDVQVNGCKQTTFSVNDAKEHVCRVLIGKDGFKAQKDDKDHDGPDKAKPFNNVATPFQPGTWHTVLIEIKGEEMIATVDGKTDAASFGSDTLIGVAKANFGFTVSGESASFRNLRVWEAGANPAWAENKKHLAIAK